MDIINYKQDARSIPTNFSIRKGIPIDTRYIINSLDTIDTELPIVLRYPGLKVFVLTYLVLNLNGDTVKTGGLFKFETDLTIPVYDGISSDVRELTIDITTIDYSTLTEKLNQLTLVSGSIVHILPLDILVILEGTTWKYLYGQYKLPYDVDQVLYLSLESAFKVSGKIIKYTSGTIPYGIIDNNLDLVDKVQILSSLPSTIDLIENGYYLVNGVLYLIANGIPYQLTEKSLNITNLDISIGTTTIEHLLSSTNILVFLRINNINNLEDNSNGFEQIEYKTIDTNNISIDSNFAINIDLIIIAK